MREQAETQYRQQSGGARASSALGASAPRRKAKRPWIVRLIIGLGLCAAALARLIMRLGRKNVPLALGVGLFAALFCAAAYNAFFRQSPVSRPVLFSTRADRAAQAGGAAARVYVARAISTQAAATPAPRAEDGAKAAKDKDSVGAFIAAQEKSFDSGRLRNEAAARARSAAPAFAAPAPSPQGRRQKEAKPVPLPAAPPVFLAGKETAAKETAAKARAPERAQFGRAQRARVQKALRKDGARGLRADGGWNAQSRAALLSFQKKQGLPATGQIDKATLAKMRQLHLL